MTRGRRLDYSVFSVDTGVTDVTKNSRLFAVTSTTCSTLELAVCLELFFPPIDIQRALINPAHPVSVPIRHPSDKSSAVTSFETDIYLHRKCKQDTWYIRGILMRVASVACFPGAWRRGS